MDERIRDEILRIHTNEQIDMLDIRSVKAYALKQKMYDLIVFINNNLREYMSFVKRLNE